MERDSKSDEEKYKVRARERERDRDRERDRRDRQGRDRDRDRDREREGTRSTKRERSYTAERGSVKEPNRAEGPEYKASTPARGELRLGNFPPITRPDNPPVASAPQRTGIFAHYPQLHADRVDSIIPKNEGLHVYQDKNSGKKLAVYPDDPSRVYDADAMENDLAQNGKLPGKFPFANMTAYVPQDVQAGERYYSSPTEKNTQFIDTEEALRHLDVFLAKKDKPDNPQVKALQGYLQEAKAKGVTPDQLEGLKDQVPKELEKDFGRVLNLFQGTQVYQPLPPLSLTTNAETGTQGLADGRHRILLAQFLGHSKIPYTNSKKA